MKQTFIPAKRALQMDVHTSVADDGSWQEPLLCACVCSVAVVVAVSMPAHFFSFPPLLRCPARDGRVSNVGGKMLCRVGVLFGGTCEHDVTFKSGFLSGTSIAMGHNQ